MGLEADQPDRDRVGSDQGFQMGRSGCDRSDQGQLSLCDTSVRRLFPHTNVAYPPVQFTTPPPVKKCPSCHFHQHHYQVNSPRIVSANKPVKNYPNEVPPNFSLLSCGPGLPSAGKQTVMKHQINSLGMYLGNCPLPN